MPVYPSGSIMEPRSELPWLRGHPSGSIMEPRLAWAGAGRQTLEAQAGASSVSAQPGNELAESLPGRGEETRRALDRPSPAAGRDSRGRCEGQE